MTPGVTPYAIICWVDVALSKLCEFAMSIAGSFIPEIDGRSLPQSLVDQRDEDGVKGAAQLPGRVYPVNSRKKREG